MEWHGVISLEGENVHCNNFTHTKNVLSFRKKYSTLAFFSFLKVIDIENTLMIKILYIPVKKASDDRESPKR